MSPLQNDFLLYARTNKVEKLNEALEAGATIDGTDECGCTALMNAAASVMACPETIKALLDAGANHTLKDLGGHTALMFAASRGRVLDVSTLLTAGADPAVTDREGKTALDHARARNHETVVELLLPLTPDVREGAAIGRLHDFSSPLCSAVTSFIRQAESVGMRGVVQSGEIPLELDGIIPLWYALVITSAPLAGLSFNSSKPQRDWMTWGQFRNLEILNRAHRDSYPELELMEVGYFAFAKSENGDVWVVRSADDFGGPVFLWEFGDSEPIEAYPSFLIFLESLQVKDL